MRKNGYFWPWSEIRTPKQSLSDRCLRQAMDSAAPGFESREAFGFESFNQSSLPSSSSETCIGEERLIHFCWFSQRSAAWVRDFRRPINSSSQMERD